jgi:hypothetical protein
MPKESWEGLDSMTLDEFKEYVKNQRRQEHDKRTSPEDDGRECVSVETDQSNEQVHGRNESKPSVKVQSSSS